MWCKIFELDHHAESVGIGQDLLHAREVRLPQPPVRVEEIAFGAGINVTVLRPVPLPIDAQNSDAISLELRHPLPTHLRALIEGGVVDGVHEAQAGVGKGLAIKQESGARNSDFVLPLRRQWRYTAQGKNNNWNHENPHFKPPESRSTEQNVALHAAQPSTES